jgi:hypothetical protein
MPVIRSLHFAGAGIARDVRKISAWQVTILKRGR